MSATHAVNGLDRASRRPVGDLIGRIVERVQRLLRPNRLVSGSSQTPPELIVVRHGPVEIRQTLAGWTLETCVKGEPDRARATASQRLSNYVNGKNRSGRRLRATRPLVQTKESTGRWRVRIALPSVDSDFAAAAGCHGRVRLRAVDSETLAVIRVPGSPTPPAIERATTAIRHAIAATRWEPTGGVMLRLHAVPTVLPHLGCFEVALPVAEPSRCWGSLTAGEISSGDT